MKNKRMFMKRMATGGIAMKDLYLGSIITVHSRQLKLVDYGDNFTKKRFEELSTDKIPMIPS